MNQKILLITESELTEMFRKQFDEFKLLIEANKSTSNEWISSTEVPSYLGVSSRCWQTYRDKNLIPFSQVGRKIWVKRSDLDAFLESCSVAQSQSISNVKSRRA